MRPASWTSPRSGTGNFLTSWPPGELERLDAWTAKEMAATAGNSAHEVRTWVAAHNALKAAAGQYTVTSEYYRPIPEYIAGFAVTTAVPVHTTAGLT